MELQVALLVGPVDRFFSLVARVCRFLKMALLCSIGSYALNLSTCLLCPPGTYSDGGLMASCGFVPKGRDCQHPHTHFIFDFLDVRNLSRL